MFEKIIFSVLGYSLGFIFSLLAFGSKEGVVGFLPNLRFSLFGYNFSPHHWAGYSFLIFITMIIQSKWQLFPKDLFYFLIAFFIGTINQGLLYSDWYIWIKKS